MWVTDNRGDGICIALIDRQYGEKESGHRHVGDESWIIDLEKRVLLG